MATTVTVNSNYVGKEAGEIIRRAFAEADTLRLNLVSSLVDIDFQVHLRQFQYANGITGYTCGFTPQGSVTLSEKKLTPKKHKNELEICKEDLRQIWSSATMGFSAHNNNMPTDVEQALLAEILEDQAVWLDGKIWNADSSGSDEFDGFLTLFDADGNIIKANNGITPIGADITEANVESELKKALAVIPKSIRRDNLKVVVSSDVFQAYSFYLVSKGIANDGTADSKVAKFGKYELTENNGLPSNTILAYDVKNLYFGTGLMQDHNEIRIKDMDESDLTGQVRYKQVFTAGVQYVNPAEIVWYKSDETPA